MDGAKERRSKERRSNGANIDGETDGQSDGATESWRNGANKRRSNRKTKQISDRGTERQSDSNKTKISRLLNCWRKIHDIKDLEQRFSHDPTVGVLEKYQ